MTNTDSNSRTSFAAFIERYSKLSDDQLLDILKNQKDYQENARNAAVKIAIERQLINSENDLFSSEFQYTNESKTTAFPTVENEVQAKRLNGSIFRVLFILSVIPLIYASLKFAGGMVNQAILGGIAGIMWISGIFLLKKTRNALYLIPLFGLLVLVASYTALQIIELKPVKIADVFVLILGTLLVAYFLFYAKLLIKKQP
jgi:hypothetical protein